MAAHCVVRNISLCSFAVYAVFRKIRIRVEKYVGQGTDIFTSAQMCQKFFREIVWPGSIKNFFRSVDHGLRRKAAEIRCQTGSGRTSHQAIKELRLVIIRQSGKAIQMQKAIERPQNNEIQIEVNAPEFPEDFIAQYIRLLAWVDGFFEQGAVDQIEIDVVVGPELIRPPGMLLAETFCQLPIFFRNFGSQPDLVKNLGNPLIASIELEKVVKPLLQRRPELPMETPVVSL